MEALRDQQMLCPQVNQRIELRLINHSHAGDLFRLLNSNRDHLRRWHPWVDNIGSADDAERLISSWREQYEANKGFCAGIWFDGQLCGAINHLIVDWSNRWTALSYWLDAAHQGQGIMTNCCRAMVAHGFRVWRLNRITIECAADNARSRAIPERLGFQLDGIVRGVEWLHDYFADHAVYGLLRSDCRFALDGSMTLNADDSLNSAEPATRPGMATDSFEQSLKLAFEMHNAGRDREAEALCRVLMQIRPQDGQLLFLLGMILHHTGRDEEAVKWLSLASRFQPRSARVFNGLGCACQKLKNHSQAAAAFERAVELAPQAADTYYNLGNSCYQLEQIERAASFFHQAVVINPRDSASWNNLGKCFKELNQLDKAIEAYDHAVEVAPDYVLARYGRAMSLLTVGRWPEGFRDYEWRPNLKDLRKCSQPAWQGESAPGSTLLLCAEQGFGDAIQMIRFIPAARERVARVVLECRPELATLFQYSKCADMVIPYGAPLPSFDCYTPLLSLPHLLGITVDAIPRQTPYLQAPSGEEFPSASGHLKVGLAWAGNPDHHRDSSRSMRLDDLATILDIPGVTFYSLQQPVPARDESYLRSVSELIHSNLKFDDFLETAAVIAQLDLVITVDTAVAHLAGALGKPVWLLIQHSPDWRWFLERADTPWYPTMQLYRQAKRGRWETPVMRVADALRRMVISRAPQRNGHSVRRSVEKPRNGSTYRSKPVVSLVESH
jgi:RimJ/RimL family protein N-acetyltransferase/Flp pilus assembly protein TadD